MLQKVCQKESDEAEWLADVSFRIVDLLILYSLSSKTVNSIVYRRTARRSMRLDEYSDN